MRTALVFLVMVLLIPGCSKVKPKSTSQTAIDNSLALASGPTAMSGAGAIVVGSLIALMTSRAKEESVEGVKSENNCDPSNKQSAPQ